MLITKNLKTLAKGNYIIRRFFSYILSCRAAWGGQKYATMDVPV